MTLSFYIIAGPTAIGKSKFAIDLAKKINGNIINADSMQVYKDLEILTARPSNQDTKIIDHHLYGYVRANERYNVEKWCNDARDKIIESQKNNIVPILVTAAGLFSLGIYGILVRRNAVMVLLAIELMLNSVNINFIS